MSEVAGGIYITGKAIDHVPAPMMTKSASSIPAMLSNPAVVESRRPSKWHLEVDGREMWLVDLRPPM